MPLAERIALHDAWLEALRQLEKCCFLCGVGYRASCGPRLYRHAITGYAAGGGLFSRDLKGNVTRIRVSAETERTRLLQGRSAADGSG